ncbi:MULTISPECIES: CD3073 family putative ECF transporter S component [unclassified Cetobacterium]|uniref:CD3073 family putative ECF transporter S component n=1 Tax=unclassified Cetobacterium TaxID=2630983 RepID=UPI0006480ECF|nr:MULTISPECIES: CD3073 family putative ECF transporter S component [unclassified Cetobacterium]
MNKKTLAITISALGIGLNIILATLAKTLHIPFLFLDTIGTILSAALLGPFFGAITGMITNIITSVVNNPIELPFAIVNMIIGIVVGYIVKKFGFDFKIAVFTGILLSIVAPLVGTPIAVSLFGGLAGGSMDILTGWLVKSGQKIFTAAFIPRIMSNLIDKVSSCIIVSILIAKLPKSILNKIRG